MILASLAAGFLMTQTDAIVLEAPVDSSAKLDKAVWNARQGTRWEVRDGLVYGQPSTPEYQAGKRDHKGLEPRLAMPTLPQDFAAEFYIRFKSGSFTKLAPFIEYGHHKARYSFGKDALTLDADSGKAKLGSTEAVKFNGDHWYHIIAEQRGDEVLIQVDGTRLFGTHPTLKEKTPKGAAGLGFCGTRGGTIEIKGLKAWSVKPEVASGWAAVRAELAKPKS